MALGAVLALSTMFSARRVVPVVVDTTPTASFSRWVERVEAPLFSLDVPDFTRSTPLYSAELLQPEGAMRDTIVLGDDKRFIRLSIQRQSSVPLTDFYVEMARRSADAGLAIAKAGQPQISASRFGRLEVAELNLSGPANGLTCAGLRLADNAPSFMISGLMCGMSLPVNVEKVACLVDRLELNDGNNADLVDIFTSADTLTVCKTPRLKTAKLAAALPAVVPAAVVKPPKKRK